MTYLWRGLLAFLLLQCDGSEPRVPSLRLLHPSLKGTIELEEDLAPSDRVLWSGYGYGIKRLSSLPVAITSKPSFMVRRPSSTASYEIGTELLSVQIPQIGNFDLIQIDDLEQLDRLAHLSHEIKGGACSKIERVDLAFGLAEAKGTEPAIYHPSVGLDQVKTILDQVNSDRIMTHVKSLESLGSRFYNATTGPEATTRVRELFAQASAGNESIEINVVPHTIGSQGSVVVKILGETDPDATVILGAHLDSISTSKDVNAPGADDDASGVAALVEILHLINSNQLKFERTVEFHAYGVEEIGLIGSGEIAKAYHDDQRRVVAMAQMDMIGYFDSSLGPIVYLIKTDTNRNLTYDYIDLMKAYLDDGFNVAELPGGTSDHKSWHNLGYPVAFAFEHPTAFNPHYHTINDTSANMKDLSLAKRIVQLNLSFLSHHAGLVGAKSEYQSKKAQLFPAENFEAIPMAAWPSPDGEGYLLAITSQAAAAYAHICRYQESQSQVCDRPRVLLKADGTLGDRNVYVAEGALLLTKGEFYRVRVYDENDHPIGFREIELF